MLQRAGLAQALLNDPTLVFLDEPTSGLDPLGRLLVRDIIGELRANGTTVFLNSHLLGEVEATCDRVAFVKRGSCMSWCQRDAGSGVPGGRAPALAARRGRAVWADAVRDRRLPARGDRRANARRERAALPDAVRWLVDQQLDFALESRPKSLEAWFVEVMGEDQRPG